MREEAESHEFGGWDGVGMLGYGVIAAGVFGPSVVQIVIGFGV